MSTNSHALLIAQAVALRAHFAHVILPIWRGPGFNPQLQLPFEAVHAHTHTPLPVTRYRAMACARQLFIFSQAGDAPHAHVLFNALRHHFHDARHGGWLYSIDANGAPLDTTKDLYTHAFVVFACAHYFLAFGNQNALDMLYATTALIETRFARANHPAEPAGLFHAALDARFSTVCIGLRQNPLMHLVEAWLAARAATSDHAFDAKLTRLTHAVYQTFVHTPTGAIAERPVGAIGTLNEPDHADNWFEPGHQFEWYFLAKQAHIAASAPALSAALNRAFKFAQQSGIDHATGGVYATLNEAGVLQDTTQRIWAQTEYLRALATHGDAQSRLTLSWQMERFSERFLHARGWVECITQTGEIARADMPSTTPYHLASAYALLPA